MHCDDTQTRLVPYLQGELSPGEMKAVQLHIGGCLPCRRAAQEARGHADVVIPAYLVAYVHGQLDERTARAVQVHLAYSPFCRDEYDDIRAAANEVIKNFSQYQLSRIFRAMVMQEWKPHRVGRPVRHRHRSFAELIERAEAGNTFTYERHVDRFKDYAYIAAYLAVKDFHWAGEIAKSIFVAGMPRFESDLTKTGFIQWLSEQVEYVARDSSWLGKKDDIGDRAEGLSGYQGSYKLRRHKLILGLAERFEPAERIPFLLYNVQRLSYASIAQLLDLNELTVFSLLDKTTREAMTILEEDSRKHPRHRRLWER